MVNKRILITTSIMLLLILSLTKSLYVDWLELVTIIVAITIFSLFYQISFPHNSPLTQLGYTAMIGFVFCYILCSLDLMLDHYLYFLPNLNADGVSLTLATKFVEYSDDLLVASFISVLGVLSLTYVLTRTKDSAEIA